MIKAFGYGRLTRDPELRHAGGSTVTSFSLASNEVYYKEGQKHEKTTFSEWQVWNGSGENLCKLCGKGDLIYVDGKFGMEEWEDKEGNKRSRPRFTALSWQLMNKVGAGKVVKKEDDEETEEKLEVAPPKKRGRPAKVEKIIETVDDELDDDKIPF